MSFSKEIEDFTDAYKRRMNAVFKEAVQGTVNRAQQTQGEGGRMPIDTGFLRASGGAELNRMPSGPADGGSGPLSPPASITGESLAAALARWKPGDAVFWGWSANYARTQEHRAGFARGAAEKWDSEVRKAAEKVRREIR